jgi:hypothetical protein
MSPRTKRGSKRYLGYLLVLILYLGWFSAGFNTGTIAALSGLTVLYGLFLAPMPCCATNRDGVTFCRNNAYGLLLGCWNFQHRWQTVMVLFRRQPWSRLGNKVFRSIAGNSAALTVVVGLLSLAATLVVPYLGK